MKGTINFKQIELAIALSLFLSTCVAFIPVAGATKYDYPVQWMNQKDYVDIGESACGPTSIAMLLNYYYPNSKITGEDVYHSGTQQYIYHGPAVGYKDVSFAQTKNSKGQIIDKGLDIVDPNFISYYSNKNSGIVIGSGSNYLKHYWGGTSNVVLSFSGMTTEIKNRPAVLNINYLKKYGHYVLLRGYDDHSTPKISDDTFFVNDPYPNWAKSPILVNRPIDYSDLFSWFKNGIITYVPSLSPEYRQYTTLVDGSHVQLDNINVKNAQGYIWQEYYGGGGDWYYPTTDGHSVTWTPDLKIEGKYTIHIIFYDNNKGNNIVYSAYSPGNSNPVATLSITQKGTKVWRDEILGTVDLKAGSYVKVNNVPANCNVDAVRFEYAGPSIPISPKPDITNVNPPQATAGDFDLTISGSNFDSGAVDQIYYKADNHFVGQGTAIRNRSGTSFVVTEHLTTPGVYLVKVKNLDGQESTSSKELTVNAAPVTLTVSPSSGKQGTKFTFGGNGYTPSGAIAYHVKKPDNIEFPVATLTASSSGVLIYSYPSTTASMVGTYTIWAIDSATGRQSNSVQETITS